MLSVRIHNQGSLALQAGQYPFALSYHLLTADGQTLCFDNDRSYFWSPLHPNEERICQMAVAAPEATGTYRLEVDIVWEGVMWLKDDGNKTSIVGLTVV
jgi:hypothetical protein